ncbi:MAG: hypothetical protein HYS86_00280 [Candidatus Chisholmbacteria bacterium]|nr:hypothetical protein [Candidatus Chisholmbacteria bacterium]
MESTQSIVFSAGSSVLQELANFVPSLLWALVIFLVGLILSNWAAKLTVSFLQTIRLEKLLQNTGVEKFLKQAEIPHTIEKIIGQIVRWIILLIFVIATLNQLGLTAVSEVLKNILSYIPNVVSAVVIIALGIIIAGVLEGMVKGAVSNVNPKVARLLGKVTSYTIMVFVTLAAIAELNIASEFIQAIFFGVVGALSLGFGLALGLGSKDIVAKMMDEWYMGRKK